jgi:hypothetical protein
VQALLIAFAMRGFAQAWNVEVEEPADRVRPGGHDGSDRTGRAATA